MLIGDHPVKGPGDEIDNPECPHSWVFACWASDCCARYVVACAGGAHVLLAVAIERAEGDGWMLRERAAGWHCPACLERRRQREQAALDPEPEAAAVGASCADRRRKRCPLVRNGSLRGSGLEDAGMEPLFAVEGM